MIGRVWRVALVVIAACVAVGGATAVAAADTARPLQVVSVDTSALPEVRITVAVPRELAGKTLPDGAFTVVEAGRKRLPTVTRLPSDALAVVLAIDTSGSMQGDAINAARVAAVKFVEEMPTGTRVTVIGFSDTPYVMIPFTTDRAALTAAINGARARGETALYDGVVAATAQLAGAMETRRSIVVLSDGADTRSASTIDAAAAALGQANTSFYAVALLSSDTDLPALNRLGAAAAGRVVSASDPAALAGVYASIASELANQYQFSFRATQSGTTDVQVAVDSGGVRAATTLRIDLATPTRVAAVRASPVRVTTVSEPLFGGANWALLLGVVLVFLSLVAGGLVLLAPRERPTTIAAGRRRARTSDSARLTDFVDSASRFADRTLERRDQRHALNEALERAGIDIRPGEFIVFVVSVALAALFVGLLLFGPLFGLVLGVATVLGSRAAVSIRAERRTAHFAEQLGDTLQLLASGLRAGHGLLQAVDTVAEESESPTREEFRRVVIETRLGKNLSDALQAAAARVRNEDFEWVVQAIDIHREIGGDLAEVLDHVAATIRDRNSLRRQVKALSAEGRLSAIILFVLPLGLTGVIAVANPAYLDELLDSPAGNVLLVVGAGLMVLGGMWMRRLTRLVF